MTPNIAITWPLSVERFKSAALNMLMKICLLFHPKWHLTMLVIFQVVAQTFLQAMPFFPLLGQEQVTSAESFPWTQGYESKTRQRRKRGLTFWAIVFGFTQAAKAKCFAIIIQGGLSLFWFKPQRVLKTEAVIFSDHSRAFNRASRETADCQRVRGSSSTAC